MTGPAPELDCRTAMRQLYDFLDNELSDTAVLQLRTHLQRCRACFDHAAFERDLLAAINQAGKKMVAPASLLERIRQQVRNLEDGSN